MLIHRYLEDAAARAPHAVALKTDEAVLTFAELNAQADACGRGLRLAGVRRGDRVAVYLDNRAEAVVAIFGTLKAGAVVMMINPSAKPAKVAHLLQDAGATALVLPGSRVTALAPELSGIPSLEVVVTVGAADGTLEGARLLAFGDLGAHEESTGTLDGTGTIDLDLAVLLYTSGSTGTPKGVMLTHANVCSAIDSIVEYLHISAADRLMNVLPLSFGYGQTQLFSAVKAGAALMLERGMAFPHATLTKMAAERVTGFAMVPTMCTLLLGRDLRHYDLSALRYVTNAGAALPVPHVRQFRQTLPHVQLVLMYGQTECLRISYLEASEVDHRADSVGRGIPNQDVWLADADGAPVAPGEVGELVVRGSHVMRGYWRMPEATAHRLRPGRYPGETVLYTGDYFRRDDEGYLYFVARGDDLIKSKGQKVSPREVEDALLSMPGIVEATVMGIDHPVWGQAVRAVVVVRPGAQVTERDVQRHCAGRLEDFMVPARVEFRDELPRTDNGKIARAALTLPEERVGASR